MVLFVTCDKSVILQIKLTLGSLCGVRRSAPWVTLTRAVEIHPLIIHSRNYVPLFGQFGEVQVIFICGLQKIFNIENHISVLYIIYVCITTLFIELSFYFLISNNKSNLYSLLNTRLYVTQSKQFCILKLYFASIQEIRRSVPEKRVYKSLAAVDKLNANCSKCKENLAKCRVRVISFSRREVLRIWHCFLVQC